MTERTPQPSAPAVPQIKTPGKLGAKKLAEIRNAIVDEMVERGFIDDDDGLREDIGDLIGSNIDHYLERP